MACVDIPKLVGGGVAVSFRPACTLIASVDCNIECIIVPCFSPAGIEITRVTYCSFQTDVFRTVAPVRVNIVCSEHEACEGTDWKTYVKAFHTCLFYIAVLASASDAVFNIFGRCSYIFRFNLVFQVILINGRGNGEQTMIVFYIQIIEIALFRVQARVSDRDLSTAFRNGIHLLQGRWTESGSVGCTYIQFWILVHQG